MPSLSERLIARVPLTFGAVVLFGEILLWGIAQLALSSGLILAPPTFIFAMLDYPGVIGLFGIVVCGVEFGLQRTRGRGWLLITAIVLTIWVVVVTHGKGAAFSSMR